MIFRAARFLAAQNQNPIKEASREWNILYHPHHNTATRFKRTPSRLGLAGRGDLPQAGLTVLHSRRVPQPCAGGIDPPLGPLARPCHQIDAQGFQAELLVHVADLQTVGLVESTLHFFDALETQSRRPAWQGGKHVHIHNFFL